MTLMVVSDSDLLRWGENLLGRGENAPKVGRKLALKRMPKRTRRLCFIKP
jgi:hypothetical protein